MTDERRQSTEAMGSRRSRAVGAAAGLIPAFLIALLFAYSGSAASPSEVAVSLGLVALIAISAGWLAGPLAGRPRRILVATVGYAIALIATTAALSSSKGQQMPYPRTAWTPWRSSLAIVGRAAVAAAGIAYLLIPALVLGSAWSVSARGLSRLVGGRSR